MNIQLIKNQPQPGDHHQLIAGFANKASASNVLQLHQSIPGYQPTPLVRLNALADRLGVEKLLVKDESFRFGLNAFKALGASFAMAKFLGERLNIKDAELTFDNIFQMKTEYAGTTFVTATDGNHGRAVAWAATKFGCASVVYLPKGSSAARLRAIQSDGADASITDLNYDDTVAFAEQMANKNNWVLLQDTSWTGYETIPTHIMQGYFSLLSEYCSQEPKIWPTHVFMQAGVGSLAAGVLAYLVNIDERPTSDFILVEPEGAACVYESIRLGQGEPHKLAGDTSTIMAGLNCGEPSHIGFKVLKSCSSAFVKCSDEVAEKGMRVLGNPLAGDSAVTSGESGAVTLGLVYELLSNAAYAEIRNSLKLTKDSRILLVSTEGDTDPEFYRQVVWS